VALLDATRLNVGVTVFVSVRTNHHNLEWLESFHQLVTSIPEVMEFYRMAGETDYLLRVVVPDVAAYDRVYKRLIQIANLSDVSSSFAMEQIKYTTKLPLDYSAK
jgi:Lrp/AsnC family transcriptional regulator